MFDKTKFSDILNKIYKSYDNQRDFAQNTGVNRGYLSRYINQKIDSPPSPKILQGIAESSRGITTYIELMYICGYITDENINELENLLNKLTDYRNTENEIKQLLDNMNLNDKEKKIATDYANDTLHQLKYNKDTSYEQLSEAVLNELKDFNNIDVDKIYGYYILKVANSLKALDYNIDNTEENHKMLKLDLSIFDDDDIEDIKKYIDFIKSKKNLTD